MESDSNETSDSDTCWAQGPCYIRLHHTLSQGTLLGVIHKGRLQKFGDF